LLPGIVGAFLLLWVVVKTRGTRWKLTSRRVERELGLLGKRVDNVELWRVRDVQYRQSLWERIFGVSSLVISSDDSASPLLELRGLPSSRATYDALMAAVMAARQQRGVMNLNA